MSSFYAEDIWKYVGAQWSVTDLYVVFTKDTMSNSVVYVLSKYGIPNFPKSQLLVLQLFSSNLLFC